MNNFSNLEDLQNGDLITISKSVKIREDVNYCSIKQLIEWIKSGDWLEYHTNPYEESVKSLISKIRQIDNHSIQQTVKTNLPCFYITGKMINRCDKEHLVSFSRWLAIDIDDYDYNRFDEVLAKLKSLCYVGFIFSTPSNIKRLKVIIQHNLKDNYFENYNEMYNQICDEIDLLLQIKVDRKCQDIGRPNYLSYGLLYENNNIKPYNYIPTTKEIIRNELVSNNFKINNNSKNSSWSGSWLYRIISEVKDGDYIRYTDPFTLHSIRTKDIDKAIFHTFNKIWIKRYGDYKHGNRHNWIFKTSQELFNYISDMDKIIWLYQAKNTQYINLLNKEVNKTEREIIEQSIKTNNEQELINYDIESEIRDSYKYFRKGDLDRNYAIYKVIEDRYSERKR